MNRIITMFGQTPQITDPSATGGRSDKVETAARVLSTLVIIGGVVGGGALLLQAPPAHAEREAVQAPVVPQAKPVKRSKPNGVVAAASAPRRIWVDPPLPSMEPTPEEAPIARTASAGAQTVPTDCLPASLRSVLRDVETRFGAVTLVSTTELNTDNHSAGGVRHRLHSACQAVDFKVKGNGKVVVAYLRSRTEVAGINSYGNNGVIHIDHNPPRQVARR